MRPRVAVAAWLLVSSVVLTGCTATNGLPEVPQLYVSEQMSGEHTEQWEYGTGGDPDTREFAGEGPLAGVMLVYGADHYMRSHDSFPRPFVIDVQLEIPGSGTVAPVSGIDYAVELDSIGATVELLINQGGEDRLQIRAGEAVSVDSRVSEPLRTALLRVVWNQDALSARLLPARGPEPILALSATVADSPDNMVTLNVSGLAEQPRGVDWLLVYEDLQ